MARVKKLPKATQKCKTLLDSINRLKCGLQTSDWALSEMVQYYRERAVYKQFILDGYEISSFNRHKHEYDLDIDERESILDAINDFEIFLLLIDVDITEINKVDRHKIFDYCLQYALEIPDALHGLAAQNCKYLVTTDSKLLQSGVKEVYIIDPLVLLERETS